MSVQVILVLKDFGHEGLFELEGMPVLGENLEVPLGYLIQGIKAQSDNMEGVTYKVLEIRHPKTVYETLTIALGIV